MKVTDKFEKSKYCYPFSNFVKGFFYTIEVYKTCPLKGTHGDRLEKSQF